MTLERSGLAASVSFHQFKFTYEFFTRHLFKAGVILSFNIIVIFIDYFE